MRAYEFNPKGAKPDANLASLLLSEKHNFYLSVNCA